METHQILYAAIARTGLNKILFQYLPNKKERKNLELVRQEISNNQYNIDLAELMQTQGQTHLTKKVEYGCWHAEFDQQPQLCFTGIRKSNRGSAYK